MDLDNFKSDWQQQANKIGNESVLSEQQIEALLQERTSGTIGKLKRNLLIDFFMMLAASIFVLVAAFWIYEKSTFYSRGLYAFVIIVTLVYSVFTAYSWMRLRQVIEPRDTLKSALEKLVGRIDRGANIMRISSLISPTFGLFYSKFLITGSTTIFQGLYFFKLLAIGLIVGVALYPFVNWYIKKMAGKHCEDLKASLKELEE